MSLYLIKNINLKISNFESISRKLGFNHTFLVRMTEKQSTQKKKYNKFNIIVNNDNITFRKKKEKKMHVQCRIVKKCLCW